MTYDPTPRSAYEHWNEERDMVWWEEVGKHGAQEPDYDPPDDPDDYDPYDNYDNYLSQYDLEEEE